MILLRVSVIFLMIGNLIASNAESGESPVKRQASFRLDEDKGSPLGRMSSFIESEGVGSPLMPQTGSFCALNDSSEKYMTCNGVEYQLIDPNPHYRKFDFNKKSHIRLGGSVIDDDLNSPRAIVMQELISTKNIFLNPQNVLHQVAIALESEYRDQHQMPRTISSFFDDLTEDSSLIGTDDALEYSEFSKAALFHIVEFMKVFRYFERSTRKIKETIGGMEQALHCIDGGLLRKTLQEIEEYEQTIRNIEGYKKEAFAILGSLYPSSNLGEVVHQECIAIPSDPVYLDFLRRILSTRCSTLNKAFEIGNIKFVDEPRSQ